MSDTTDTTVDTTIDDTSDGTLSAGPIPGGSSRRRMLGLGLGTATIGALMTTGRASAAVEYMRLDITNMRTSPTGIDNTAGDAFVATTGSSSGTALKGSSTNLSGGTGVAGAGETAGVTGTSVGGSGVEGSSTNGSGVRATSQAGAGLSASSQTGVGVSAFSPTGIALAVEGRLVHSRSGVATVAKDKAIVVVDVPGGVKASTFALATLQKHRRGIQVVSATPDRTAGTLTIRLNRPVGTATKVGWLVLS